MSKGAPQVITALCAGEPAGAALEAQAERFASRGYRSPAVAQTTLDGTWHLLGVLALADPPREDSAATISAAHDLGVDVKMVTGDQVAIGSQIAHQVGLGDHILPAGELGATDSPIAVTMSFVLELIATDDIPVVLDECRRALHRTGRLTVVSLDLPATVNRMTRLYLRAHRRWPRLVDCRPIPLHDLLLTNDYIPFAQWGGTILGIPVVAITANPTKPAPLAERSQPD